MEEGRAYTRGSLGTIRQRAVAVPARFRLPSTEHWGEAYGTRQPDHKARWRMPLLRPPPWPPMVPTSAARRPIALRREPTFLRSGRP